jgi:hypothetical protein
MLGVVEEYLTPLVGDFIDFPKIDGDLYEGRSVQASPDPLLVLICQSPQGDK